MSGFAQKPQFVRVRKHLVSRNAVYGFSATAALCLLVSLGVGFSGAPRAFHASMLLFMVFVLATAGALAAMKPNEKLRADNFTTCAKISALWAVLMSVFMMMGFCYLFVPDSLPAVDAGLGIVVALASLCVSSLWAIVIFTEEEDDEATGKSLAVGSEAPASTESSNNAAAWTCCFTCCWTTYSIVMVLMVAEAFALASNTERYDPVKPEVVEDFVDITVDDTTFRIVTWCVGKGAPNVLFMHGLSGSHMDASVIMQNVSETTRACSFSRAGIGYSDYSPQGERRSKNLAAEAIQIVNKLNMSNDLIVFAHSFGGYNSRLLETHLGDRIKGLVLVDAVHPDNENDCSNDARYWSFLYRLGEAVFYPAGVVRLALNMKLVSFYNEVRDNQSPEIQNKFKQHVLRTDFAGVYTQELAVFGRSCFDVVEAKKARNGEKYHFPIVHVLPNGGIHKGNDFKNGKILHEESDHPDSRYVWVNGTDGKEVGHLPVLFSREHSKTTTVEVLKMVREVREGDL